MVKHLRSQKAKLDDVDVQLLRALKTDAKISIADLARAINMSGLLVRYRPEFTYRLSRADRVTKQRYALIKP